LSELTDINFRLIIDDEEIEVLGYKCYVVNSARAGTGLAIGKNFKVDDGLLDVFMLAKDWKSSNAALNRFFGLDNKQAGMYYWQGQKVAIHADQEQPVWTDGEYTGRTPVSMAVVPGGLTVAVG
jgi:diacylglycerol kinase family enzyme